MVPLAQPRAAAAGGGAIASVKDTAKFTADFSQQWPCGLMPVHHAASLPKLETLQMRLGAQVAALVPALLQHSGEATAADAEGDVDPGKGG